MKTGKTRTTESEFEFQRPKILNRKYLQNNQKSEIHREHKRITEVEQHGSDANRKPDESHKPFVNQSKQIEPYRQKQKPSQASTETQYKDGPAR